jgi:hypothetical protein
MTSKKHHKMSIRRAEKILIEHGFSPARVKLYAELARSKKVHHRKRPQGKGTMLLSTLY